MTGLRHIAREHGVSILDDAAHAASYPAQRTCLSVLRSLEPMPTAFSFYANKTSERRARGRHVRDAA